MSPNRSIISPLRIDAVTVPVPGGLVGMTICPGKDEYAGLGIPSGPWKRDLDLLVIRDWGAHASVFLIEPFEFELLSVSELPEMVRELGLSAGGHPDQGAEEYVIRCGYINMNWGGS